MPTDLINYALTQSIFCGLFVWLGAYVLKRNDRREEKYQQIIENLTDKFEILECMSEKIDKIQALVAED